VASERKKSNGLAIRHFRCPLTGDLYWFWCPRKDLCRKGIPPETILYGPFKTDAERAESQRVLVKPQARSRPIKKPRHGARSRHRTAEARSSSESESRLGEICAQEADHVPSLVRTVTAACHALSKMDTQQLGQARALR
jgi:hypothetical protein